MAKEKAVKKKIIPLNNKQTSNVLKKSSANKKPKVTLVSYSIKATIPTAAFGNIMPEITVQAATLEEAHDFAMPYIENLYQAYAEDPRDGRKIKFIKPDNVTVTERKVNPAVDRVPVSVVSHAEAASRPAGSPGQEGPTAASGSTKVNLNKPVPTMAIPLEEKTPFFQKAENAISNSFTTAALDLVQSQIKKSTNLTENEKEHLYTNVLKKRSELTVRGV